MGGRPADPDEWPWLAALVREAAIKVLFFVDSPLRPLAPPPQLIGQKNGLKKPTKTFPQWTTPYPLPPSYWTVH